MHRQNLVNLIGYYVAVGIPVDYREWPFYFFGKLEEVGQENILLKLHGNAGYRSIKISKIISIHKDKKFTTKNRRHKRN